MSTQPPAIGFMIPVNKQDFLTIQTPSQDPRSICTALGEGTIGAPWYTCENIRLTGTGAVDAVTARVGDSVTIQVGIQALPTEFSETQSVFNVQAWVCYPNTVAGETELSLVVPSMQSAPASAVGDYPVVSASSTNYQNGAGFQWISLSSWMPSAADFMDQGTHGGHCCIIANSSGTGNFESVGQPLISNLQTQIRVCTDLYQGQRNIAIVPAPSGGHGGRTPPRFGFLSGAPGQRKSSKTTIAVNAIKQGGQVDPLLLEVLKSGPYAGLPLKPATLPPKSLRLARHDCQWNDWLCKIIHEAEEIIEELLGLETHPFGGGHQLHLSPILFT